MAFMKFYTGSEANAQSYLDGIYLATDTHKLFYKGSPYGGDPYVELDWIQDFKSGSGTMEEAAFEKLKDAVDNYKLLVVNCTGAAHSTRVCTPEIGDDGSYICKFTDINNYENAEEYILAVKIASVNPSTRAITMLHDTTYPLGGKDIDLSNYYTIAQVDGKIGTNVYTGANYISKETNLTEAVLQLDEEIKATNDNLALEHANAEATYAKKTELGGYLPLSGGELSGSLYITGSSQLQLIGIGGNLYFKDTENKMMVGIETMSDYTPVGGHGAYGTIYCSYTDDSSKSTLSPGWLALTNSGESIYVRPSGIEKSGGSPTKVFATDGSVVDMNTYLPLSGGTMTGDIVRKDSQNRTIYTIGTVANGPWIQCNDNSNGRNIKINGSEIEVFGGGGTATIPNNIRYAWDNIHFSLWPDNTTNRIYKFNLQKLIDDGYLIEE